MVRLLIVFFVFVTVHTHGQYFQQKVDHRFIAALDTAKNEMEINHTIVYHNNAPKALDTLYFHLWANAFSSLETPFAKQQLQMQSTDFYFSHPEERGGLSNIEVGGSEYMQISEQFPDLGYIILEESLRPGDKKEIKLNYTLDIPSRWNRLGYDSGDIYLMHWYIKPAVYDMDGWHWFSYLVLGEFYSDYGDYEMQLTVPHGMQIAATGMQEKSDGDVSDTYFISAENVLDLALVASFTMEKEEDTYTSRSGNVINLEVFRAPENQLWADLAMTYLKKSVEYYEESVGLYPYPKLTLVDSRRDCKCGMEYPMLITVSAQDSNSLDYYINHEVGHQWFYGVLGFNERNYPYMDEGLTTYFEHQYTYEKIGTEYHTKTMKDLIQEDLEMPLLMYTFVLQKRRRFSQSPSKRPEKQSILNYGINAYERAAYSYAYLASYIGKEKFNQGIQSFYDYWSFKHPRIEDFVKVMEEESEQNLDWFIPLLTEDVTVDFSLSEHGDHYRVINNGDVTLPFQIGTDSATIWYDPLSPGESIKVSSSWNKDVAVNPDFLGFELDYNDNDLEQTIDIGIGLGNDHSSKSELYWMPTLLYNYADGFQLGTAWYNSTFMPKNFQYFIQPSYAFSSKQLTGNAWVAYNQYFTKGYFRKIQWKLSGRRFSDFYSERNNYRTQYMRLSPQVSFHINKDPSAQKYAKFTARGIILNTENALFSGPEEFTIEDSWNTIYQLRYDFFDFSVLNRKEFWLALEKQSYTDPFGEGQDYLKATAAFKYWTSYAKGKLIGFRLFGSGFLRNTQRQSSNYNNVLTRGSIALLHQGFNDYQYEDYFINRQGNPGPATNQISFAGGGFKDALGSGYNIGMSNDWAVSVNVYADLPLPLPALFKLKPFVDVGYYRTKSTLNDPLVGKTLVSGGLMLSYLDGSIEVYLPLFASDAISNIYNATGENIFQRISFRLDLHRLNPWDLQEDLNF